MEKLVERFYAKTERNEETGCLEWTGGCSTPTRGEKYGSFNLDGKVQKAHRVAWQIVKGPIPDGLFVLHKCDNPKCVEVDHLFLGTRSDNMLDMALKGRAKASRINRELHAIIRERYALGETQRQIAADMGIARCTVSLIINQKRPSYRITP